MNWIKITPETELPKRAVLLLRDSDIRLYIGDTALGRLDVDHWQDYSSPALQDFTHYMILEEPKG